MFSLSGKMALVTGASGGIGQAIAKSLAAQGAKVALSGTSKEKLENTRFEINMPEAPIFPCNLADTEAIKKLAADAETALGSLDILVNNAGITKDGLALRMGDEDWNSVLNVNLTSAFVLCRSAIRGMMKRRFGRIINITSIVGVMGNPGQANYAASKAGMIGFSKSLAAEVASRGITVNCIAPGFIQTAMTDKLNEEQKQAMLEVIPQGAFGTPDDVAASVIFLASTAGRYITGQTLHVNGGMLMV